MKRRQFIKLSSSAAIAVVASSVVGCVTVVKKDTLSLNEELILKGFEFEQEESPILVSNGNGDSWLFSLRRMHFPEDTELISVFYNSGNEWVEQNPASLIAGQYEAPTASCAKGGNPVVAWTEINGNDWSINVSMMESSEFIKPHVFNLKQGNSNNPILISPTKNRNWIAWEHLKEGKFTIYISKFELGNWSEPVQIDKGENSCFTPSIAESENGDLYVAYGITDGFHQNIEFSIIDGNTCEIKKSVPVAIGGGFKDRVNINSKPSITFDSMDNLWISYENNRFATRLDDGDNYTGDRACAMVSYQDGKIVEVATKGKWLFKGENDHNPTFFKDISGNLFVATHCGGTADYPFWRYRISWLDPKTGWQEPKTLVDTKIKGMLIPPAITFTENEEFWFATTPEKNFYNKQHSNSEGIVQSRLTELSMMRFVAPEILEKKINLRYTETQINEFKPSVEAIGTLSGHPKVARRKMTVNNETFTLLHGNLHEHSNSSYCWPAGTDGTLEDDYRFGMFSEGYDFIGITDHANSTSEIHWRKNIRLADFYNESNKFIAIPSTEWTLSTDKNLDDIQHGAGHYNVIFASTLDAKKYIRNKHEIYCRQTPESEIAPKLWEMLHKKNIDCVTIPHHSADDTHPTDWNVTDTKYVPVVEIFQCRGNNEYSGAPRERNLERHNTTHHKHAFIDYALKTKKYKLGFIASGDHNSMGIGLAALWVKEVSRAGIIGALKNRRTFGTTGDKIFVDFKINQVVMGATTTVNKAPKLEFKAVGQYALNTVEILRNSEVIKTFNLKDNNTLTFEQAYIDKQYLKEKEVLYYYVRVTQINNAIAWSSPIWIEKTSSNN
jgi:hypothetical protein